MRGIDQSQPAALGAHPLDRRDGPFGALGDRRVIEVGIEVLVFLDEHEQRAARDLLDQPFDVVGRDAGGRLQDRAEGRLVECEAGLLADADRAVRGAGKAGQDVVGNLDRDQPGVLHLVHVEDDRAGERVQQVARGDVSVGVPQHLERKRDVEQPDPAGRVKRIDAGLPRRALLEQRTLGRVLDAAGGVVADLLDGLGEGLRAEGKVVGRDDVVGNARRQALGHPVGHHLAKQHFASVKIVPEAFQGRGREGFHLGWRTLFRGPLAPFCRR